jgi:hypothetical protein
MFIGFLPGEVDRQICATMIADLFHGPRLPTLTSGSFLDSTAPS